MIKRGDDAVKLHADKINELKERLGGIAIRNSHSKELSKAVNLNKQTISYNKIQFTGINAKEERYLRNRLKMDPFGERPLHIVELEDAIATMIGTKAFEKVTYEILGDTAPYTLQFNCYRSPINQLGASVRFDAIDFASILIHNGINTHQLTGSRVDFTARLGLNTILSASHTLRTGQGVDFGTDLSFQAARNGAFRIDNYDIRIDFNRGRGDIYLSLMPWRMMILQLGIRADYFYRTSMLVNYGLQSTFFDQMDKSNIFVGPYAQLRSDSFDDPYFPTLGVQFKASYNWIPLGLQHDTKPLHCLQIGYRSAHGGDRTTAIPFLDARYVSATVVPYINMLSVNDANSILDQQITFAGINTPVVTYRTLFTTGFNLRQQFGKRHYVTATAQIVLQSDKMKDFFYVDSSKLNFGFALEYAYNSIVGPIRANVHWSDISHSIGFYLGIGFDF